MIRDRLRTPDVFVSADPAVNVAILMGPQNRNIVEWYLTFAAAEMVLGYNPKSRFKDDFEQAREGKLPLALLLLVIGAGSMAMVYRLGLVLDLGAGVPSESRQATRAVD